MRQMPVRFDEFRWIYPPRPKGSINPAQLGRYSGFIAQYKYHDVRTVVYLFPDGRIELFGRLGEPLRSYQPSEAMEHALRSLRLRPGRFHVLDGGLLHTRTRWVRERLVLWDVLVHDGEYLLGTAYRERYGLLRRICREPEHYETETGHELALRVTRQLWLAPCFTSDLPARYSRLIHLDEVEGLVLKDPNGTLKWGMREENNGDWQIRVRKPSAVYAY